ncbi:MAG: carbamoyltransferase [Hyphomicrobiaceae bacterium]
MKILGISAYYHDSAAALVVDGVPVAAAQEERFTRIKHDASFPQHAIRACLGVVGLSLAEIDEIVFFEKPFVKFERLLETYLALAPRGFSSFKAAMPVWIKDKLFQKRLLADTLARIDGTLDRRSAEARLRFSEHHLSHAASAYYPSPFDEAVVLTMDGVGEWATTSVWVGRGKTLEPKLELHWPHSLGLLYSAFTAYTGFRVNSGEYKVMGLAPYGRPIYADAILDHLIDVRDDGSFWLDQRYFNYASGLTMTSRRFHDLFGGPPREPDTPVTQREMDIAASIQSVTETVMLKMTRNLRSRFGIANLCLAGGVALNCVANGKVLRDGAFDRVWVQPAAGDAGGALGAALALHALGHGLPRARASDPACDAMSGSYLGTSYADDVIAERLAHCGARFTTLAWADLIDDTAARLERGDVVGWFQGRMEYGPRALGARSILGDARNPRMQQTLNQKIKYRESFRPFAPAVLAQDVADYFEYDGASPYMLMVANVKRNRRVPEPADHAGAFGIERLNMVRSDIPAVTHVDFSARVQTVHHETNPRFHDLLSCFKRRTGSSVLVNTSFNVRGEPIVESPEDAFRCFMGTEMDALAIGRCLLVKSDQDPNLRVDYVATQAPD